MTKISSEISIKNYSKLLNQIKSQILATKAKLANFSTRQKVVMSWEIGRLINENLLQDSRSAYGKYLFESLEEDLQIKKRALYKMLNFYQAYPKLPKNNDALNWSHYRTLVQIKDPNQRHFLENFAIENNWTSTQLENAVKKNTINESKIGQENQKGQNGEIAFEQEPKGVNVNQDGIKNDAKIPAKKPAKLTAKRGQLYSYPLIKLQETNKFYLDLGFNIFREIAEELSEEKQDSKAIAVQKIASNQEKSTYQLIKTENKPSKFNTYKAFVERVVDGDTLRLTIDLGFGILHKEIIRLRGIDAAESNSEQGKKAAKFLTKLLAKIDFVVVKTIKTDIYGRFVADVFLPQNFQANFLLQIKAQEAGESEAIKNLAKLMELADEELNQLEDLRGAERKTDPQKIADNGIYLNQLLLDAKMAEIF